MSLKRQDYSTIMRLSTRCEVFARNFRSRTNRSIIHFITPATMVALAEARRKPTGSSAAQVDRRPREPKLRIYPNKFDALAARGQRVFEREGCAGCHTPPTYTNNKLTPADGFNAPNEHLKQDDIMPMSVGTDPRLTLKARRGTGYYKVPSLRGVWCRGPFEHNGSVATLEDWFDPSRLRDDYAPTGFRGYGVKSRAVKGHQFGLDLSTVDRKALIAFLKTL